MINREVITKIYKDLLADNQKKRAYVDGVFRGLQLMRDHLLIQLESVQSTQGTNIVSFIRRRNKEGNAK